MIKLRKKTTILGITFLLMLALSASVTCYSCYSNKRSRMDNAHQLISNEKNKLQYIMDSELLAARILEMNVVSQGGEVTNFEETASALYVSNSSVRSLQLAPDGVVTYVYPLEGNEGAFIDLFADPDRRADAELARDTDEMILSGPFELAQGGMGLVARNPIYLTDENGNQKFWGFSIVVFDIPELLDSANLDLVNSQNFYYRFWRMLPGTNQIQVISENTEEELSGALQGEVNVLNASWFLDVVPRDGWIPSYVFWTYILLFLIVDSFSMLAISSYLTVWNQRSELRFNNREYGALLHQSTAGTMRYDITTGTATLNVDENLNRVEEYTVSDYERIQFIKQIVARETMPAARAMFQDIHAGRPSAGYDIQLIPAKGDPRWCRLDYTLIRDKNGAPYRAVVAFCDNTRQRERELEYQKWRTRFDTFLDEYTAYLEVNLSRDSIEAEGRNGKWIQNSGGRCFSETVEKVTKERIFEEDQFSFRKFFHRERMLGQFLAGKREGILEYRVVQSGEVQWSKAVYQLVTDPVSEDIKAAILISNVDEYLRDRKRLESEAERDIMTGLYNHATSEMLIRQVLELSVGQRCCLLIIDLDDLRDINSNLGHPEGDRALIAIADCMRAQFRKTDIMGRIGGDEFIVLLRDVPEIRGLENVMEAFLKRLNSTMIGPDKCRPVRASIGGVFGTAGGIDSFDELYRKADLALFYTKAKGKNGFSFYTPELEKREFEYRPSTTATLTEIDPSEHPEMRKLLQAMAVYCPLVISVNLTRNTYTIMEHVGYATHHSKDTGVYDQLIMEGCGAYHPDDRESFLACFKRENMLWVYSEGKGVVQYTGRQMGDDGIYRKVRTVAVFMKDEETGDICEVSFTHILSTEEERKE